jgi:hypothetical protein
MDEDEKRGLEQALAADNVLASRLEEIRRSDEDIRGNFPAYPKTQAPRPRYFPKTNRKQRRKIFVITAALLCLGLPVIGYLGFRTTTNITGTAADRIKGTGSVAEVQEPFISLYLKTSGNSPIINSAEKKDRVTLHEGDTVQLVYNTGNRGQAYGVIFSVDGHAALTLHYPYAVNGDTQLVPGKDTALAEAYTLDDAPAFEKFFFILGDSPLDTPTVLNSASGSLPELSVETDEASLKKIFGPCDVETLIVYKE